MSSDQDLLRDLQAALAAADVDVAGLVEGAWEEAQTEVRTTLRRLMARDLLERAVATLGGHGADPTPATAGPAPAVPDTAGTTDPDGTRAAAAPPATAARRDLAPERPPGVAPADGDPAASPIGRPTYLFGIVPASTSMPHEDLSRLPGGGPVRMLSTDAGRAVVCDVDPATFEVLRHPGPEGLDLLAEAATAHDRVLARFVGAPVLPLPLGTVLPDDRSIVELLDQHADPLQQELVRHVGLAEWAVTVRTMDAVPTEDEPPDPTTSGTDYLRTRRAALERRESRWADQERLLDELHGPLAASAEDAQVIGTRPLEEASPPLLHGVYLVHDEARDRFLSTVAYLRSEHPDAVVEVTGPWPPYHFTAVDLSAEGEPAS